MRICWDTLENIGLNKVGYFSRYYEDGRSHSLKYYEECKNCKEPFLSANKLNPKYCSSACNNKHRSTSGKNNGRYSHGMYVNESYKTTVVKGKSVRIHTKIAEEALGRKLKRNECVHHIDMNKHNNDKSNLVICDISYHRLLHHRMAIGWVNKILKNSEVK